jgi:hypothetical protein
MNAIIETNKPTSTDGDDYELIAKAEHAALVAVAAAARRISETDLMRIDREELNQALWQLNAVRNQNQ